MEPKLKKGQEVEMKWLLTGGILDVRIRYRLRGGMYYRASSAMGEMVLSWNETDKEWEGGQTIE